MVILNLITNLRIKSLMKIFRIYMEASLIASSKNRDLKSPSNIIYNLQRKGKRIKSRKDM
jgi:hypothetical protein